MQYPLMGAVNNPATPNLFSLLKLFCARKISHPKGSNARDVDALTADQSSITHIDKCRKDVRSITGWAVVVEIQILCGGNKIYIYRLYQWPQEWRCTDLSRPMYLWYFFIMYNMNKLRVIVAAGWYMSVVMYPKYGSLSSSLWKHNCSSSVHQRKSLYWKGTNITGGSMWKHQVIHQDFVEFMMLS